MAASAVTSRSVAKVLGMEILVADPYATVSEPDIQHVPLDDLLARADFVVCLAIANEQTENLIGQAALARMQRACRSSSISRAAISSTKPRCRRRCAKTASRAPRWMSAARSDQMPSPELAALPNVIATPHIGGLTPPAIESQSLETVQQVAKIIAGEAPVGAVNADRWTRSAVNNDLPCIKTAGQVRRVRLKFNCQTPDHEPGRTKTDASQPMTGAARGNRKRIT